MVEILPMITSTSFSVELESSTFYSNLKMPEWIEIFHVSQSYFDAIKPSIGAK